jgi:branched-chain amino acid transport system permease protein
MFLTRSTRYVDVGLTVVILLVAASTPLWLSAQYLLYLGGIWLMYALLSYGLAYLYAQSGQLSIAHAALWGVGAYTSALLLQHFGWGFWTSLTLAALAAAFTAAMVGLPALRLSSHYFVIATFAVAQFLVLAAENLTNITNGPTGLTVLQPPGSIGPIQFGSNESYFYLILFFVVVGVFVFFRSARSGFGRKLMAVRENEKLARAVGINASSLKVMAFAISGLYAGVAGAFYVYYSHEIEPDLFGANIGLVPILIAILGGRRTLAGPLVGAFIWVFLPQFLNLDPIDTQLIFGLLLVVAILLLPKGIVGTLSDVCARLPLLSRLDKQEAVASAEPPP